MFGGPFPAHTDDQNLKNLLKHKPAPRDSDLGADLEHFHLDNGLVTDNTFDNVHQCANYTTNLYQSENSSNSMFNSSIRSSYDNHSTTTISNGSSDMMSIEQDEYSKKLHKIYHDLPVNFRILVKLGEGAFSKVYRAVNLTTHEHLAIKIINKSKMNKNQLNNVLKEISIMRKLDHRNIIKLINFVNAPSSKHCYIFMELIEGGELFNKIIEYTYFSEDLARHVIIQVATAVKYLHEEVGVVHRDIKPENLLFVPIEYRPNTPEVARKLKRKSDESSKLDEGVFIEGVGGGTIGVIKLADFGLSKVLWDTPTKTPCGTAGYTAPEVIKDETYSKSVDLWSIGCVLYTILSGFPPFYDTDQEKLTHKILNGQYEFLSPWWDEISPSAKNLVNNLLHIDPKKRLTIDGLFKHPWILNNDNLPLNHVENEPPLITKPKEIMFDDDYFFSNEYHVKNKSGGDILLTPQAEAIRQVFNNPILIEETISDSITGRIAGNSFDLEFSDDSDGFDEDEDEDEDISSEDEDEDDEFDVEEYCTKSTTKISSIICKPDNPLGLQLKFESPNISKARSSSTSLPKSPLPGKHHLGSSLQHQHLPKTPSVAMCKKLDGKGESSLQLHLPNNVMTNGSTAEEDFKSDINFDLNLNDSTMLRRRKSSAISTTTPIMKTV